MTPTSFIANGCDNFREGDFVPLLDFLVHKAGEKLYNTVLRHWVWFF